MIPILYEKNERDFITNGVCRLIDILDGFVEEERNGIYECEFKYPVTGEHFSDIQEGRVICVWHDDSKTIQPFDIYGHSAPMDGVVTFYAHHISYRLGKICVRPFTASSCLEAFAKFQPYSMNANPFTFWTDKSVESPFDVIAPSNLKGLLGGQERSILDVYGKGDYEWDKYTVKLHLNRGQDNGVSIRYGKNLTKLTHNTDISEAYNAVAPYWLSYEGDLVELPEGYITCSSYEEGQEILCVPMDLSDRFDEAPTVAQLRSLAQSILDGSESWTAKDTVDIDFINLWESHEYETYKSLQRVCLCDKVTVINPKMDLIKIKMEVVKAKYNFVTERYDSMTLGTPKTSFADAINASTEELIADLPNKSFMQAAIDYATKLIQGSLGGHVVFNTNAAGQPEEILIMDTDDTSTAVNVWRFNLGGLGHSHSGYNGPFNDIALTMDGRINATMITTGILNAGIIKAGILSDLAGLNYWNLQTGEFHSQSISTQISNLQDQIDDNIQTYSGSTTPTLNNYPASSWSEDEKATHVGDLYVVAADGGYFAGFYYRFEYLTSTDSYQWTLIKDTEITKALADAAAAQETIDDFLENDYPVDIAAIQNQIDSKIETFYQSGDPSTSWTAEQKADHIGDLWYKTTDNSTWRWDGTQWVEQSAPKELFDAIDGKAQIFTTQPVPPYNVGDLWFNSASSDILTCMTARAEGASYNSGDWVKRNRYTDDTTANQISQNLANNYYTKTSTETLIQQSGDSVLIEAKSYTDSIEIGGRNLLPMTKAYGSYPRSYSRSVFNLTVDRDIPSGWFSVQGSYDNPTATYASDLFTIWSSHSSSLAGEKINSQCILSCEFDGEMLWQEQSSIRIGYKDISGTTKTLMWNIYTSKNKTFVIDDLDYITEIVFYIRIVKGYSGSIDWGFRLKLERGNKATDWSPAPEDTDTKLNSKVGNDEIISKINVSPEQVQIASSKINLIGKTIDLSTDNIILKSASGDGEVQLYYDPDEISIVDDYGHVLLPVHIGGRGSKDYGWLDIGFGTSGRVRIYCGNYDMIVSNSGIIFHGPNGSWSPPV